MIRQFCDVDALGITPATSLKQRRTEPMSRRKWQRLGLIKRHGVFNLYGFFKFADRAGQLPLSPENFARQNMP